MKDNTSAKTLFRFGLAAYFALALATSFCHYSLLDSRVEEVCLSLHEQVLNDAAPAPIQYRILTYYAAEGLMKLGLSFEAANFLLRFAFTFLSAAALHYFLAFWFAPVVCLAGSLFFLAALPVAYIGYYMQPMDLPNLFFLLAGCILILKRKDLWLIPLVTLAMLNRETAILIVLIYAFVRFDELELKDLALRSGLIFAAGMLTYWFLRKAFELKPNYSDLYFLDFNLKDLRTYAYALALFGPLIPLSLWKYGEKPKFIRRALLFVPFFVIIHYTIAIMTEPRLWLPVLPFLLAAGLWAVVPEELKIKTQEPEKVKPSFLTKFPKTAYLSLLLCFLVFFTGFCSYYEKLHFADRERQKRVEEVIAVSREYSAKGLSERALEELNKGLVLGPENADIRLELAIIYRNSVRDYAKALYYFRETLNLNPYHIDKKRILREIALLEQAVKK